MKGKAEEGGKEREVGELALVGTLDRWIVERERERKKEAQKRFQRTRFSFGGKTVAPPSLPLSPSCFTYRTETSRNDVVSALPSSARSAAAVPSWLPASVVPAASLSAHRPGDACVDTRHGRGRRTHWVRRWRDSSGRPRRGPPRPRSRTAHSVLRSHRLWALGTRCKIYERNRPDHGLF